MAVTPAAASAGPDGETRRARNAEWSEMERLAYEKEALGFYLVGYGCTTCIGNSGPLPEPIAAGVESLNASVAASLAAFEIARVRSS